MSNRKISTFLGCSMMVVLLAPGLARAQNCDSPALCAGDVNGDGAVDPLDSGAVLARFGLDRCDDRCQYDVTCDGTVDPLDLGFIVSRYGTCDPVIPCDVSDCFTTGACCAGPPTAGICFTAELPACTIVTEFECDQLGNLWLGEDSACEQEVMQVIHTATQWTHEFINVTTCPTAGTEECVEGPGKIDPWITMNQGGSNCENFGAPGACPIPADFFGPGSELFDGEICFLGEALGEVTIPGFPGPLDFGDADTLVLRSNDPFDRCDVPSDDSVTVDIELIALNLVSCDPIEVIVNGQPELWDVRVAVSDGPQPTSTLTATKDHCNGGTFDSVLAVCPKFVFTKVDDPKQVKELDFCQECDSGGIVMETEGVEWIHDVGQNVGLISPVCSDFHPGLGETEPTTDCDCNTNQVRDDCDIEAGVSQDCNGNGIPDECDLDSGASGDCNTNGIPDECDISSGTSDDCNTNGIPDQCDLAGGTSPDCNANSIPDDCDIAQGTSADGDGNSVPDECDFGACCPAPPDPGQCSTPPFTGCEVLQEADCDLAGNLWLGPNTECEQEVMQVIHTATQWTHEFINVTTCPTAGTEACVDGPVRIDPWVTLNQGGSNCENFGSPEACPIPADFFGPGSDLFDGEICFLGQALGEVTLPGFPGPLDFGDADTLVGRSEDPFDRCDVPSGDSVTVDIELLALSLVSCDPIIVTFGDGDPEAWDVRVELSDTSSPPGSTLTATKDHCNGGTFDSVLAVCPNFVFTRVSDGLVLELDFCTSCDPGGIVMETQGVEWIHDVGQNVGLISPVCSDFHPGIEENQPNADCDCNSNLIRDDCELEDQSAEDCNGNEIPDECDIAAGVSQDCDANGVPDECDLADGAGNDCNDNGIPDACDVASGASQDCNENTIPDECDLAQGTSTDTDGNGVPDDCDPGACCPPPVAPGECANTTITSCESIKLAECDVAGGLWLGPNTECEQEVQIVHHTATQWSHEFVMVTNCPDGTTGTAPCVDGPVKIDPWVTTNEGGSNCEDFGSPDSCPLPADFFGPGSDSFVGVVCFRGEPLGEVTIPGFPDPLDFGDADTLVSRTDDPFDRCDLPTDEPVTVGIELVALNLVGCEPITVLFGGADPEEWEVRVEVSANRSPPGSTLTATKEHCNGGTFDSVLAVCPIFVFTKADDPGTVLELDFCGACDPGGIVMETTGVPWVHDPADNVGLVSPVCSDFHPGIAENEPITDCDCNENLSRDKCDIEDGLSQDCDGNGVPDECDIAGGTSQDCNGNGIPDECDIAGGTSDDCNANAVPDDCEPDADSDGVIDDCDACPADNPDDTDGDGVCDSDDICPGSDDSVDEDGDGVPDGCDACPGEDDNVDCQPNGVPDACEIADGTSEDCNGNGVPDECEVGAGLDPDCNGNGIPDECEIDDGTAEDCNNNGRLDECDIAIGVSEDCNANGVPDECDIASGASEDCNDNGIPDVCEIGDGTAEDCNENAVPDECDISNGTSEDGNNNGIPDECDPTGACCFANLDCLDDVLESQCSIFGVWTQDAACDTVCSAPCVGGTCGNLLFCGPNDSCFCMSISEFGVDGPGLCVSQSTSCFDRTPCPNGSNDCTDQPGGVCGIETCCGEPICLYPEDFDQCGFGGNVGEIAAWGINDEGQGNPPSGNDFVGIGAGFRHGLAVRADGSLAGWGRNDEGQTNVPSGNDFAAVAGGTFHSLALKTDGSLAGWGGNAQGQASVPSGTDFTAIAGGLFHSFALKTDGSIVGWGLNSNGQLDIPAGNDFAAIASGEQFGLALRNDGSLVAWGDNGFGQLNAPSGNDFVAIAVGASGFHGVALRSDGSLAAWGRNDSGQSDAPAGNDFAAIAAGVSFSAAIKTDGSLTAWGSNGFGELNVPSGNDFTGIVADGHFGLALRGGEDI